MNMLNIIEKKKLGYALSDEEIEFVVKNYTDDKIPDYQMSAFLMCVCFNKMTDSEMHMLTKCMAESGDMLDLSQFGSLSVDKHSTGGVGDKTTLIVAPIVAALGGKVAKMSGRGLSHTGGTVDKLEAIPGYKTDISVEDFYRQVKDIGICVIGQTGDIAPADKKIYALRDVSGTVNSIELIASSIMSKKLAAGAKSIVLDVKTGSGAFMKSYEQAKLLAEKMIEIGKISGRNICALITDMNSVLGRAVGNSLEVIEAIDVLKGKGPLDLREICIALSANMLCLCMGYDYEKSKQLVENCIEDKSAYNKFIEWICAQGGDESYIENTEKFEKAKCCYQIISDKSGYVKSINTQQIGSAAVELGAGRKIKGEKIDFAAGVIINKKIGELVTSGQSIATIYTNKPQSKELAEEMILNAYEMSDIKPDKIPLMYGVIK